MDWDEITCINEQHTDIMRAVRMQLASLFITMITFQNAMEFYYDVKLLLLLFYLLKWPESTNWFVFV